MNSLSRNEGLDRLRGGETWDILVIGGGATGLGTAVDAAWRGYRTLLLEAHDFAHGTSSRSTKLIHGGVRYLAQGNIPLIREALHERGLLLQNAPHLVHSRAFVVPAYHYWQLPYYGMGLWLYDRLAGKLSLGRSRWISRTETLTRVPTIRSKALRGGILYTDGQFDDARLAVVLARTVADLGGCALNYLPVTALTRQGGRLAGAAARDLETGEEFAVTARALVNASGVNADVIRRLDEPGAPTLIAPSQGATSCSTGRSCRARPPSWCRKPTTAGSSSRSPGAVACSSAPRKLRWRLCRSSPGRWRTNWITCSTTRRYIEKAPARADIKSAFAGLRPLIRPAGAKGIATSRLSREHVVSVSKSGLVTVTGGKWTTYRVMAREAVDHAARVGKLPGRPCATASLRLHGWRLPTADQPRSLALYGSDLPELNELIRERPDLGVPLHPALPYIAAEVVWAARHEAARMIEDVLARRTRALFLDARASLEAAPRVAALLARELGRDQAWQASQVAQFRRWRKVTC